MKILYFFWALSPLFLATSCTSNTASEKPKGELDNAIKDLACLETSYHIYNETATMWEQSWAFVHQTNFVNVPIIEFSRAKVDELKLKSPASDGVRIYYCLQDSTDTIPSMAMVNVIGCTDQLPSLLDNCILVADHEGNESFKNATEVCLLTCNWRKNRASMALSHAPVYAYNYRWSSLDGLLNDAANPNAPLCFKYGLRTVSPHDLEFSHPEEKSGHIVYVNIAYGGHPNANLSQSLDFTMPCPQLCDDASPLMGDPGNPVICNCQ